jgi:hypothetical protein
MYLVFGFLCNLLILGECMKIIVALVLVLSFSCVAEQPISGNPAVNEHRRVVEQYLIAWKYNDFVRMHSFLSVDNSIAESRDGFLQKYQEYTKAGLFLRNYQIIDIVVDGQQVSVIVEQQLEKNIETELESGLYSYNLIIEDGHWLILGFNKNIEEDLSSPILVD